MMTEGELCIMIGELGLYICLYILASSIDKELEKLKKLEKMLGNKREG